MHVVAYSSLHVHCALCIGLPVNDDSNEQAC